MEHGARPSALDTFHVHYNIAVSSHLIGRYIAILHCIHAHAHIECVSARTGVIRGYLPDVYNYKQDYTRLSWRNITFTFYDYVILR